MCACVCVRVCIYIYNDGGLDVGAGEEEAQEEHEEQGFERARSTGLSMTRRLEQGEEEVGEEVEGGVGGGKEAAGEGGDNAAVGGELAEEEEDVTRDLLIDMYASLFRLLRDSIEWWCFTSGEGARVKKNWWCFTPALLEHSMVVRCVWCERADATGVDIELRYASA